MQVRKLFLVVLVLLGMMAVGVSAQLAPEGVTGETYFAPFPVAITLDGSYFDWNNVPQVYMGSGVGRPAMTFAAAADATNLYLYANIVDTNIISGQHGADYWNEDSLEFYINATGDLSLRSYTDGVAQLTIPALNASLTPEEAILAGVRGDTLGATIFASLTDTGWAVEVAIPLVGDVFNIVPTNEGVLGFNVHLNAASEVSRDAKLMWGVNDTSDTSYQNPSVFSQLIFAEAATSPVATGEYAFSSTLSDEGLVDDFENGIWVGIDTTGSLMGLVGTGEALGIQQIMPESANALPDNASPADNVLNFEGGFSHVFTNSMDTISEDWSAYNAVGFWYKGGTFSLNVDAASLEIASDTDTWQHIVVPFALLEGEVDWAAVNSYGLSGSGYLDDVKLYLVENESAVIIGATAPEARFIIDESIAWDSRTWELTWADEFDAAANTAINSDNWTCEIGGHGFGNNELEYYTDELQNVSHDGNGNLVITAMHGQPADGGMCWYGRCAFTSARCTTQNTMTFTYGRVEARLRIPTGQGVWPAFWSLGADFPAVGWPQSGEIDIMENIGSLPNMLYGTVHGPSYSGASGIGNSHESATPLTDDFHVYAIDWDPNIIRWYVDGELFGTVSINDTANREWVFDHDFFLIMNIAVGGAWPGNPTAETPFPQQMLVDYVRVYELGE